LPIFGICDLVCGLLFVDERSAFVVKDVNLPIAYCKLPIEHCLLQIAYCKLPIAHCPLLIAFFFKNLP
jgi:hypothetical protein